MGIGLQALFITDSPLYQRHVYGKSTISTAYSAMIAVMQSSWIDRRRRRILFTI